MGVAQIAGMTVVPAALVSERLAAAAGWMAHIGAAGLVRSADLVRFAPALTWRVAPPSWMAMVAYYGAGAVWWALWRRRLAGAGSQEPARTGAIRRTAGGIAVAAGLWMLVNPLALLAVRGDGALHATFIDVGQGDSIFVVFPRGKTMLVDAGGLSASSSFDIGDRVVAPVIRHAGFRRIDYLVLTHGDPDHIGGAGAILREFRPREVWEGIPVPRFEALTALRVATRGRGRPLGERLRRGPARRRRRRGRRAPPAPRRLGAPEGPQRRFDRARAAVARPVGALDRRHRPRGGARDRRGDSGGAPAGREGPAPRQPDLERAGVPRGGPAAARRRQRRARQPLRAPRAGGARPLHRHRRRSLPHRPRRRRDDGQRRVLDRCAHIHRPAIVTCR